MKPNSRWLLWILPLVLLMLCSCDVHKKLADLHFKQGMKKLAAGHGADALDDFSSAIAQDPQFADAYLYRGACYLSLSNFTAAIKDFNQVTELNPDNERAFYFSGTAELGLKDYKRAITNFTQAIGLQSDDADAWNYRGMARANLRDLTNALADFNKVIELTPEEATAYRNRAAVEGLLKDYEKALADASQSIELNNHDAYAYRIRGQLEAALKNFQDALADFDQAIELAPGTAESYASRASVKLRLDDFDAAGADLEKAFQLNSKSALVFVDRGFLKEKQGDYTGALADFNQAAELGGPQLPETCASLGLLQYNLSQWNPAMTNLRKAQQMGCIGDDVRFYIWLIQSQSGNAADANKELKAFLNSLQGDKATDWTASLGHFLVGDLPEDEFLKQAATKARRPSAIKGQVCESYYYAGMKHKLAGDQPGAVAFFQKCLDTKEDNSFGYISAQFEMRARQKPRSQLTGAATAPAGAK